MSAQVSPDLKQTVEGIDEPSPEDVFSGRATPAEIAAAAIQTPPGEQALAIVQDGIATGNGLTVEDCQDVVDLLTGRINT